MTPPLVCVTVAAATMAELRRRRDEVQDADLVELRLDSVTAPDVEGALEGRNTPVIVTCRAAWEGGDFKGSEEERRQLLARALDRGAEFVDIEWRSGFDDLIARERGRRIVLSMHDFEGVPDDLDARARAMRGVGAEVVKIAVKANRLGDCVRLLTLSSTFEAGERKVLIGMGEHGVSTRVLAARFGSAWSYTGALRGIGQIGQRELLHQYRFRDLTASTSVLGLTGAPIAHSVSPAMHNAAIRATGTDAVYLPFPAVDADDFMQLARALPLQGASVTIPFKVALAGRVDAVDAAGSEVGAINTIRASGGRWEGTNTDVAGFLAPLDEAGVILDGCRASILGAGGSARAVAAGLRSRGATVLVHARNPERAGDVAAVARGAVGVWPPVAGSWDLLVNCTPVGMHPRVDESPVPAGVLAGASHGVVYDLIYNPQSTKLLKDAGAAGCRTIGGLDMLVAQAAHQFRWWTGVTPDSQVMRRAALDRLSEFATDENHVL